MTNANYTPPVGYDLIAKQTDRVVFDKPVDLAYGVDGSFLYLKDQKGEILFEDQIFGGDPAPGIPKAGYVKVKSFNIKTVIIVAAIILILYIFLSK